MSKWKILAKIFIENNFREKQTNSLTTLTCQKIHARLYMCNVLSSRECVHFLIQCSYLFIEKERLCLHHNHSELFIKQWNAFIFFSYEYETTKSCSLYLCSFFILINPQNHSVHFHNIFLVIHSLLFYQFQVHTLFSFHFLFENTLHINIFFLIDPRTVCSYREGQSFIAAYFTPFFIISFDKKLVLTQTQSFTLVYFIYFLFLAFMNLLTLWWKVVSIYFYLSHQPNINCGHGSPAICFFLQRSS